MISPPVIQVTEVKKGGNWLLSHLVDCLSVPKLKLRGKVDSDYRLGNFCSCTKCTLNSHIFQPGYKSQKALAGIRYSTNPFILIYPHMHMYMSIRAMYYCHVPSCIGISPWRTLLSCSCVSKLEECGKHVIFLNCNPCMESCYKLRQSFCCTTLILLVLLNI